MLRTAVPVRGRTLPIFGSRREADWEENYLMSIRKRPSAYAHFWIGTTYKEACRWKCAIGGWFYDGLGSLWFSWRRCRVGAGESGLAGQSHDDLAVPSPDTNSSWTVIKLKGMGIKGGSFVDRLMSATQFILSN
jgi:hypothetical protein